MIQRLITVYTTISASMGYWLFKTNARSAKVRTATRCARKTANTWPNTINATERNHNIRAFMILMFSD